MSKVIKPIEFHGELNINKINIIKDVKKKIMEQQRAVNVLSIRSVRKIQYVKWVRSVRIMALSAKI